MRESKKVLTRKSITKLGLMSPFLQASFNYGGIQAGGFTVAQLPFLRKIYKNNKKTISDAMSDNLEFINTYPNLVGPLMELLISLEEDNEDRSIIKGLKVASSRPLVRIGDAILWFTLLPVVTGINVSFTMEGSMLGPIIFFTAYLIVLILRITWTHLGYNLGVKAIDKIKHNSKVIGKAATVLGVTVIGGLIASYVKINALTNIVVNESKAVSLQTDFFDKIFPNTLPLRYTLLMYFLVKNKRISPVVLIFSVFIMSILLLFVGIL